MFINQFFYLLFVFGIINRVKITTCYIGAQGVEELRIFLITLYSRCILRRTKPY